MDNNIVERAMRPIALNRKNALFAGSDEGGAAWGVLASLIETCKLNGVEPHAYLTDVLTKIVNAGPQVASTTCCRGPTWPEAIAYCSPTLGSFFVPRSPRQEHQHRPTRTEAPLHAKEACAMGPAT